jgi:FAD synthase
LQKINSSPAVLNDQQPKQAAAANEPTVVSTSDNSPQLLLEIQKKDRDLAYKDEEIRSLKTIA